MTIVINKPTPCTVVGSGYRRCKGCPRCQDPDAGFCKTSHSIKNRMGGWTTGLHPICRKCGHCVLRGSHANDTSDLEVQDRLAEIQARIKRGAFGHYTYDVSWLLELVDDMEKEIGEVVAKYNQSEQRVRELKDG